MASTSRDYQAVVDQLKPIGARDQRMLAVVDALWVAFENHGYSWVGFYLDQPNEPDEKRLMLGSCRDKPACSPIGLRGMCWGVLDIDSSEVGAFDESDALGLHQVLEAAGLTAHAS